LDKLDGQIAQVNARFKLAQMGFQVERRGSKLNLRGTLPPKPGSNRLKAHQQRLSLGLPATAAGLKEAEQRVKVITAQLIQNSFDWRNYLEGSGWGRLDASGLAQQIEAFERHYLENAAQSRQGNSAKTTWSSAYAPYLRKLEAILQAQGKLTVVEAIYATVRATEANSRSRQLCCTALGAFARWLNLDLPVSLKDFWGSYGNSRARQLPTDALILETWERIPNPAWRFVYGVMAVYGLRNHEVFFCNYDNLRLGQLDSTVQVLATSKTGSHEVWPFLPEWINQFELRQGNLPPVGTDLTHTTLQRVGQRVTAQFRRYDLPFSPYDLRHAWAVRTILLGLPDTVAAKMMGHSVAIHTRTYHQWITRRDQQAAVDAALGGGVKATT
jgi:integrase